MKKAETIKNGNVNLNQINTSNIDWDKIEREFSTAYNAEASRIDFLPPSPFFILNWFKEKLSK